MDKPVAKKYQRRRHLIKGLKIAGGLALLLVLFVVLRRVLQTTAKKEDFVIATVNVGPIERTISAQGEIIPAFEEQINSPISTQIKALHTATGTEVAAGELLMDLERSFLQLDYEGREDELELKKNKVERLKYEYDKDLQELASDDSIKALRVESLTAQLKDARRLLEVGSATEEEVEQAGLELKIEQLQKKKLANELAFRQKTIKSDRRNLELEVEMQEKKLQELGKKLQQTEVRAPRPGVVTWINESIGKQVSEGEALVRLANLQHFRVRANCSDRYANRINVGQAIEVRINTRKLVGSIASILPAVENNTLSFMVDLQQPDDKALRPNQRVEVLIISESKATAMRLRNGPAITGAREQPLFVVREGEAVRRQVRIGMINQDFVEINGGDLQPGDRVIISDVEQYTHLDRIELK